MTNNTPKDLAKINLAKQVTVVTNTELIKYQSKVKNKNTTGWPMLKQMIDCYVEDSDAPALQVINSNISNGSLLLINSSKFVVDPNLQSGIYGKFIAVNQIQLERLLAQKRARNRKVKLAA